MLIFKPIFNDDSDFYEDFDSDFGFDSDLDKDLFDFNVDFDSVLEYDFDSVPLNVLCWPTDNSLILPYPSKNSGLSVCF